MSNYGKSMHFYEENLNGNSKLDVINNLLNVLNYRNFLIIYQLLHSDFLGIYQRAFLINFMM